MWPTETQTMAIRSPEQWRERLGKGLVRARTIGCPVVVAQHEPLWETPDLFELFAAAETRGQWRFLAARPDKGFALLTLGAITEIQSAHEQPFDDVRKRARALLRAADPEALLVGGFAFAALPSAERDPIWRSRGNARFVLPALIFTREGSETWLTRLALVDPTEREDLLMHRCQWRALKLLGRASPEEAGSARLRSPPNAEGLTRYTNAATEIIAAVRRGEAEKVVLACVERVELGGELPTASVLRHLSESHSNSFLFAEGLGDETFLGATPEELIRLRGDAIVTSAVAGTVAHGDSAPGTARLARALRRSPKERAEHAFVVRAIEKALAGHCRELEVPRSPALLDTGSVQHLHTQIRGKLARPTHVLDLVARLHPTPAVAGTPHGRALELIRKHEHLDRGWYAGPLGFFNGNGDGEFVVALRCGLFSQHEARLYAGAGLVAGSEPELEAAETALKLRTLRGALEAACSG